MPNVASLIAFDTCIEFDLPRARVLEMGTNFDENAAAETNMSCTRRAPNTITDFLDSILRV